MGIHRNWWYFFAWSLKSLSWMAAIHTTMNMYYVVNLRETQKTSKWNVNSLKINVNDIVLVFYEKVPKRFWKIAIVTRALPSRDSEIRGAIVRITKTNTILKHPVNKVFAVENTYHDTNQTDKTNHTEIASPFSCCHLNRE